jgi:toxin-antitoxin system PIN domain toxin
LIVPDANLLIYAYDAKAVQHRAARIWLGKILSESELVGVPWQTVSAFIRITTNSRLTGNRFPTERGIGIVQQWMNQKHVRMLSPSERHWSIFQRMLIEGQIRGPDATDAQLAALTIEYGGVLYTTDRDFARFPGLRWVNPLLES